MSCRQLCTVRLTFPGDSVQPPENGPAPRTSRQIVMLIRLTRGVTSSIQKQVPFPAVIAEADEALDEGDVIGTARPAA